jgi:hypothetical protein
MADTVEALIGAVYIDGGLENVKHVMRGLGLGCKQGGAERGRSTTGKLLTAKTVADDKEDDDKNGAQGVLVAYQWS